MLITSAGDVQARRPRSNTAGDVALSLQPTDSTIHYGFRIDAATNSFNLDRVGTGNFLTISPTGNVGIGGSPSTEKLKLTGQQHLLQLTRGGGSDSKWFFSADSAKLYIAEDTTASSNIKVTIIDTGSVGIGTVSPSTKLDVEKNQNALTAIKVKNTDAGTGSRADLIAESSSSSMRVVATSSGYTGVSGWSDAGIISTDSGTSGGLIFNAQTAHLSFQTATNERMRITSGGNVGIGTTSIDEKLQVEEGNIKIEGGTNSSIRGLIIAHSGQTGNQTLLVQNSTNPRGHLYTTERALRIEAGEQGSASGGTLDFWVNQAERMMIDTNGNVGIGETSPKAKLNVTGTSLNPVIPIASSSGGIVRIESGNGGVGLDIGAQSSAPYSMWMQVGNTSNDSSSVYPILLNPLGGDVGIGTISPNTYSSQTTLTINGSTYGRIDLESGGTLRSSLFSQAANTSLTVSTGFFSLDTDGSERMRITSGGNVGIGRTARLNDTLTVTKADTETAFYSTNAAIEICNANTSVGNWRALNFKVGAGNYSETLGGVYVKYANFSTNVTGNLILATRGPNATDVSARITINEIGAVKFDNYNSTNNEGSPTHILGTDASGNVVKSTAGSSIGPWLPLAAGSGDPLTGDLYINKSAPALRLNDSGSNKPYELRVDAETFSIKEVSNSRTLMSITTGAVITLDSLGSNTVINTSGAMIVPNGSVGIGTTSPGRPLTINSDNADRAIRILENDSANESWDIGVDVDGDLNFFNSADTSPSVTFLDGGNVGIGTINPLGELHINAPTGDVSLILSHTQNVQNSFIDFNGNSGGTQARIAYGDALGDISISPNFSAGPAITLKNNNNVGIGLTNPGQKLEVAGNVKVNDGYIRSEDGATGDFIQIFNDGAVSGQSFITTSSLDLVLIPQNGKLQVKGENFGSGNNASLEIFNALNAAVKIKLNSNGDSFLNGGDVGIGTSSPAAKLDVAGVIFAADGNKALPGYSFASDPDTGMIRDSANVLTFVVGADRRMSISTTAVTSFLPLGVGVTGVTSGVQLQVQGNVLFGSSGVGDFYLGNYATSNHFRFHTNNSNTFFDMNCGDIYWRQGTSTRYTFFPSTANMTVNGTITQLSDIRNKENIVEIGDCINKVQAMRGVYYNRTDINTEVTKVGVIAQEVENVLPELIIESPEDGLKSVAYSELTAVLINAIKEQQEIIEDLKTRITKLEN